MTRPLVLVTGATGYVGGRLVPELLFSCPVYSFYLSFDAHYRWEWDIFGGRWESFMH